MNGLRSTSNSSGAHLHAGILNRSVRCAAYAVALLLPGSFLVVPLVWLWRHRHGAQDRPRLPSVKLLTVLMCCALLLNLGGCSLRNLAVDRLSDAVAQSGTSISADNDPELIRAAVPFSLKLMESLLAENPTHKGLLLAGAKGFTQYCYAFVQQEADEIEGRDLTRALALRQRARKLYSRAQNFGVRGLSVDRPEFVHRLHADPRAALAEVTTADIGLLYWTAASWGALITLSKDAPAVLAEIPIVEALIDRALELDEAYDNGAIHTFLIGYEMVRQGRAGEPALRARAHFERALELSSGTDLSPLVALAESVSVPQRQRAEFEALLKQALRFDANRAITNRLANLVMQKRARWLLAHIDELFVE